MRREYLAMTSALREFIEQPDDPVLVIKATDVETLMPLKTLVEWNRQPSAPVYMILPFACADAGEYVRQSLDAVSAQIEQANAQRARDGLPPWPPLPLPCRDPRREPANRLFEAMAHVRGLLAPEVDLVWALLPGDVSDAQGYKAMVAPLLRGYQGWMRGQRFILRERRDEPFLIERGVSLDGVLRLDLDFSTAKAADELVKEAQDPLQPAAQRMQALMQLAAFDLAHGHLPMAHDKYALLFDYHTSQRDAVGQALALGGAGDVATRLGQHQDARLRYQQALAVAGPSGNLVLLLNLLMAAGNSSLQLGHHAEAERYYELASRSAGKLLFVHTKIQAMEQQGMALVALGKPVDAARLWIDAKGLCREFNCIDPWRSVLGRLRDLYAGYRMRSEVQNCEEELAALDAKATDFEDTVPPAETSAGATPSHSHRGDRRSTPAASA